MIPAEPWADLASSSFLALACQPFLELVFVLAGITERSLSYRCRFANGVCDLDVGPRLDVV
jgi:hypothetical protein